MGSLNGESMNDHDLEEGEEPNEEREDIERSHFGMYTQSGTFVGTGGFHPDPVRVLVENTHREVSLVRDELADLSGEVASMKEEIDKIGRIVLGLHEILLNSHKD